jgi:hypothetical protein
MQLSRFVGFIDLGVAAVVLVMLVLPAREMYASSAYGSGEAEGKTEPFALALAEARTQAHPDDGAAIAELSRALEAAGARDWALEVAVRGSERAKDSPTRWRALMAAAVALVERNDVVPALDYANRALEDCAAHAAECPSWEQVRMKQYQEQLDAGVKSGIDPHAGPDAVKAFRHAGERALRQIRLGGRGGTPPSLPSSGSAAGNVP